MKKTTSLFLAVLLLFSLCACGKAEESERKVYLWNTSSNDCAELGTPLHDSNERWEDKEITTPLLIEVSGKKIRGHYDYSYKSRAAEIMDHYSTADGGAFSIGRDSQRLYGLRRNPDRLEKLETPLSSDECREVIRKELAAMWDMSMYREESSCDAEEHFSLSYCRYLGGLRTGDHFYVSCDKSVGQITQIDGYNLGEFDGIQEEDVKERLEELQSSDTLRALEQAVKQNNVLIHTASEKKLGIVKKALESYEIPTKPMPVRLPDGSVGLSYHVSLKITLTTKEETTTVVRSYDYLVV